MIKAGTLVYYANAMVYGLINVRTDGKEDHDVCFEGV